MSLQEIFFFYRIILYKGEKKMSKLITCHHCGNKTLMEKVSTYVKKYEFDEMWEEIKWNLFICPACQEVTLEKETLFSEEIKHVLHENDDELASEDVIKKLIKIDVLYPYESSQNNYIPYKVKTAFEAAVKVKNIDGAICAIAIRRTLEMMCKEKGETKGNLFIKLQKLSQKGILPPIINDMAGVLREVGNSAAHADEEFKSELVPSMIEFTTIILDYVYNLPNRIADIQEAIHLKEGSANLYGTSSLKAEGEVIKN